MSNRGRGRGGRGRGRGGLQPATFPGRGLTNQPGSGRGQNFQNSGEQGQGGFQRGGFQIDSYRGGSRNDGGRQLPQLFTQGDGVASPNRDVQQIEDDTFGIDPATTLQNLSLVTSTKETLRPSYATRGNKLTLYANYFELKPNLKQEFNIYSVEVVPVDSGPKAKKFEGKALARFFQLLLRHLPSTVAIATDQASLLVTSGTLGFEKRSYPIQYYPETQNGPDKKSPHHVANIQFMSSPTFQDLVNYQSSPQLVTPPPAEKDAIIRALNIVLGYSLKSNQNILTKSNKSGRNKYFPISGESVEKRMLSNGLEAFRGFFMSVRPATGRLLLNVQVQHIAAYEGKPLVELFNQLREEGNNVVEAERLIKGAWVHVSHLNNRIKKIAGFATPRDGDKKTHQLKVPKFAANAKETTFYKDNEEPADYVSVADHFKQAHKKSLQRPDLPVINVGNRGNPIYMPAEMCTIKKGQDFQAKLSPKASAEMIEFAVRPAPKNATSIARNGINLIEKHSKTMLQKFGVEYDKCLITIPGRLLPGYRPIYSEQGSNPRVQDASWNMANAKVTRAATFPAWTFLWIRVGKARGQFENLGAVTTCVMKFRETALAHGINAPKPNPGIELNVTNAQNPLPEIDQCLGKLKESGVKLVLVILPDDGTAIYNAIKIAGDIKHGIHTVNVIGSEKKFANFRGNNVQYFANVALKFNLKLGGQNQSLKGSDLNFISEGKTMLVGLDVTHPSPGSADHAPSVSSITASIDKSLSQWPADVRVQKSRQEMVEHVKDMFKSRLALWQRHNQQLPEQILIYRDGVGETMYDLVLATELPQIREACKEVYPATATAKKLPYITVIICGKRHHTRFYPTKSEDADRNGSTKNGTVIDRGVTESRVWDFYLQAHNAIKGTPKSAHYVIIHDEIFLRRAKAATVPKGDTRNPGQRAADDMEALTHALSYMFGRATKAVSLIPPAYYADLICDRARRHLSRVYDERSVVSGDSSVQVRDEDVQVHADLKDSMYYI